MSHIPFINGDIMKPLLNWEEIGNVLKQTLIAISLEKINKEDKPETFSDLKISNPERIRLNFATNDGVQVFLPGHIIGFNTNHSSDSSLGCKIISVIPKNNLKIPPLPTISGYLFLFNHDDGKLYAILDATLITEWRTASVSCIATELLWKQKPGRKILAMFGAGAQARIHAIALLRKFNFDEVRIWNRTLSNAAKLINELKSMNFGAEFILCQKGVDCATNADVIVTATSASAALLQEEWVKNGAFVISVAFNKVCELSLDLYNKSDVYVEDSKVIKATIPFIPITGELGELLLGLKERNENPDRITVFQSFGSGIHDTAVGKLIYNKWIQQ